MPLIAFKKWVFIPIFSITVFRVSKATPKPGIHTLYTQTKNLWIKIPPIPPKKDIFGTTFVTYTGWHYVAIFKYPRQKPKNSQPEKQIKKSYETLYTIALHPFSGTSNNQKKPEKVRKSRNTGRN